MEQGAEEVEVLEELEPIPELPAADDGAIREAQELPPKKSRRLPPLLRLTRRAVVFLSLTLLATILLFLTGNRQTFLDSNLRMILKIIACNAIALSSFSALAVLECIFYTAKDKKLRLVFHLFCYIAILLLGALAAVLSLSIHMLSEGITF